jgi:glycosyltransferase involved in cell wall biosynthesis
MTPILMYVVNVDWFFVSHRLAIALAAQRSGYQVHVATGLTGLRADLEAFGFTVHSLTLDRGDTSPAKALRISVEMWRIFRSVSPDLVHLVTIKPVLFGGLAARAAGVPAVVAAISGLGYAFVARGCRAKLRRIVISALYRLVFAQPNVMVIFQNPDDQRHLIRMAHLPVEKSLLVRGSGVDLGIFVPRPLADGVPIVMLAARLLADKGVREFVEAAKSLKARGCDARFVLVGQVDPHNPSSLAQSELDAWMREGAVECWGRRDDMPEVLALARLVVLPSYREGMPKVLLEAAACGRTVVTTDVPGCRDAIEPGVSGVLVPVRDAASLAQAIGDLLDDLPRCLGMGNAGRALAVREFDVQSVVAEHLSVYARLFLAAGPSATRSLSK